MKDELKEYIEKRIGFSLEDDYYYSKIKECYDDYYDPDDEFERSNHCMDMDMYIDSHDPTELGYGLYCHIKDTHKWFKKQLKKAGGFVEKEIDYKNVKEISIKSKYRNDEDLLRISSNWISYKKQNGNEEESWSYKSTSDDMVNKFYLVIASFYHLQNCPPEFEYDESKGETSIRVTFKDDTYITFYRTSTFGDCLMYPQAISIINMIPNNEIIPNVLKPFINCDIEKEDITNIKDENVVAVFLGGDMGRIGEADIVTKDHKIYSGGGYTDKKKIYNLLNSLNDINKLYGEDFIIKKIVHCNDRDWLVFHLGGGNRLFISSDLMDDIGNLFSSNLHSIRINYLKWNSLTYSD